MSSGTKGQQYTGDACLDSPRDEEIPGKMTETFRPPILTMKLFWDSSAEKQPRNFEFWLMWFENWFALQNALLSDRHKLSAMVKCWSLVQHLGPCGRNRLATCFAGTIPRELNMDYEALQAVLSSIFAEVMSLRFTRH